MALNKKQLKDLITDTLKEIDLYSDDAVNLLLGTCAQESGFGTYIKQLGTGPALGIFQVEPNTFIDHVANFLNYKEDLSNKIVKACNIDYFTPDLMMYNLKFAICIARVHYLRVPKPLPKNIEGYAKYWKDYYNTYLGAGTEEEFIFNYKKFVL